MDKRTYFNQLAPQWDSMPSPPGAAEKIRRFITRAVDAQARRVLDAGCGTGILLQPLMEERPAVEMVCELDFAEAMLRQARLRVRDRRICVVAADTARLPFQPASFDAVLCFGLLPHLPDPVAACREFVHCLRPGGALAVCHLRDSSDLNAFHAQLNGPVAGDRLPPAPELAELVASCGAKPLVAEEEPGWYFVLAARP